MTGYSNDFEGGTLAAPITGPNSGGVSGDQFDSAQVGVSSSMIYDNTHPIVGSMCCQISGGNAVSTFLSKAYAAATAIGTMRIGLFFTAFPAAALPVGGFYSGSTVRVRFSISSTGKITINSPSGGALSSANSIPLNQPFFIEAACALAGGTSGSSSVKLYDNVNSSTPKENFGQTGVNYTGTADRVRFGVSTNASGAIPTFWMDALAWNDTGDPIGSLILPGSSPGQFFPFFE